MLKCRRIHGIVVLLAVAAIAMGLLAGCGSKANSDAEAHLDSSTAALRESAKAFEALKTVLEKFASDAPGLKPDEFATRHAEVAAAIDDAAAKVATARSEAEAVKAVSGVSKDALYTGADIVLKVADSNDAVLNNTRKMLDENLGDPGKFAGPFVKSTTAVALTQIALLDQARDFASTAADKIDEALGK